MLDYLTKDDLPEGVIDVVDVIGMDAFKSLVKFAGGGNLYIPNEASLVKGVRNTDGVCCLSITYKPY